MKLSQTNWRKLATLFCLEQRILLNSRIRLSCGGCIVIISILCYALLHDISETVLLSPLKDLCFFEIYRVIQSIFISQISDYFFYPFLVGHLVDILWFLASFLFFSVLYPKSKYILLLLLAVFSEFSQLLYPRLGTFDAFDLTWYGGILIFLRCMDGWLQWCR